MRKDFHIVGIDFQTPEFHDWRPDDPFDCEIWATVNVGDDDGSAYYDVRVCTHKAFNRIEDKRYCFTIDEYRGVPDLIAQLSAFIVSRIPSHLPGDPYQILARYWHWEYSN